MNENNIWPLAIITGALAAILALESAFNGMANAGNLQVPHEEGDS